MNNKVWSNDYRVSVGQQMIGYLVITVFGLIPSLSFFVWVGLNCHFDQIFDTYRPIWFKTLEMSPAVKCIWNAALFLTFGVLHSIWAQKFMKEKFQKVCPPQFTRAFFICWTGMTILPVMMFWKSFNTNAWEVEIVYPMATLLICFASFNFFMYYFMSVMAMFGLFEFFGYAQISQSVEEIERDETRFSLKTDGIYGVVRHPMYLFLLAAFIVTPIMSFDRLYVVALTVLDFYFAIPIEEKKLIAQYGQAYEKYRQRVPAVIPAVIQAVIPAVGKILGSQEKLIKTSKMKD